MPLFSFVELFFQVHRRGTIVRMNKLGDDMVMVEKEDGGHPGMNDGHHEQEVYI